ncbi:PH domain-containing protein [Halobacillus hunanensis]|uniref:PH domain-containing protein n=1 Tax=Halobacillus hunanensis TaxID=578214 RepID=UPI0009A8A913|nr:PH domain-containing protein [Halobacillus hunanensis]
MKFKVKKNPLLVMITLALIPIGLLGFFSEEKNEAWISLLIVTIIAIPMLWALVVSYHEVTDTHFRIVFGPIKKSIPLYDIKGIHYSYNPLSSPAWTFKRLEITYSHYNSILASTPKNESSLRDLLKEKCPRAKIEI